MTSTASTESAAGVAPVLDTPGAMRSWSDAARAAGRRIGLVPTMGALHEGHLALIRVAQESCDVVITSIFVNPLQFNREDDFTSYPRPMTSDIAACRGAGVAAIYAPTVEAMYPAGFETHVEPGSLADVLEGAGRPGHFRGVLTVVSKLFGATRPDIAVFGQKDFQQLAVLRRMVADLDMGIRMLAVPTVREADGLALSSRNRRLDPAQRRAAGCVPRALSALSASFAAGERSSSALVETAMNVLRDEPTARVEYVSINDAATLAPVERVTGEAVASTAVWFGDIRLIDNHLLTPHPE